jgi:hypothetical protein
MKLDDSSDRIKNIIFIILILLGIVVSTITAPTDKKISVSEDNFINSINSLSVELNPLKSYSIVSNEFISSINSPIFITNDTNASIGEDYSNIITPTMQVVINCESGSDNSKIGDLDYYVNGKLSPSYGIAQFQVPTWEWMSELSGIYGDIYSERDQLILMRWAFDMGYAYHWSCYVKNFM